MIDVIVAIRPKKSIIVTASSARIIQIRFKGISQPSSELNFKAPPVNYFARISKNKIVSIIYYKILQ